MLGQTPFVGYAVVDFATEGTPEPSLDTAFVPGGAEEPEWFIALASPAPIRLDEYTVVQSPLRAVALAPRGADSASELMRASDGERRARDRMAAIEAEANELRARLRALESRAPDAGLVTELRKELQKRDVWIAELEARAGVADARADEAEARLEQERERQAQVAETQEIPVAGLEHELDAARAEIETLRARVDEQATRIAELTDAEPVSSETEDEIGALERQLADRGSEVRRLERELAETERVGRLLLREVEDLSEINAAREADLEAARWTLESVEGRAEADPELAARLEQALGGLQSRSVLLAQLRARGGS
jgi:chromosome segregation ATPase